MLAFIKHSGQCLKIFIEIYNSEYVFINVLGVIIHHLTCNKTLITRLDENVENNSDEDEEESYSKSKFKKEKIKKEQIVTNKNYLAKIVLKGLSISNKHAIIERKITNSFVIKPALSGAKTKINGQMLVGEIPLNHKDRILFGTFLYINYCNQTILIRISSYVHIRESGKSHRAQKFTNMHRLGVCSKRNCSG